MAERVGFVPDEPSILNDFGRITMASGPLAPSPVDTSRPEVASRIGRGRQEALAATLCPRDAALTERDLLQAVQRHAKLLGGVELPSTQRFSTPESMPPRWITGPGQCCRLVIVLDGDYMAALPSESCPVAVVQAHDVPNTHVVPPSGRVQQL